MPILWTSNPLRGDLKARAVTQLKLRRSVKMWPKHHITEKPLYPKKIWLEKDSLMTIIRWFPSVWPQTLRSESTKSGWKICLPIKANGFRERDTVKESWSGRTAVFIKGVGSTIAVMAKENWSMPMVEFMKENSLKILLKAKEFSLTPTGQNIKETGKLTSLMEKV